MGTLRPLRSRDGAKGRRRLVPGDEDEGHMVEAWLEEALQGLEKAGLGRAELTLEAGLSEAVVDRLYRGLYTHSIAFQDMVDREAAQLRVGTGLRKRVVLGFAQLALRLQPKEVMATSAHFEDVPREYVKDSNFLLDLKGAFELRTQVLQKTIEEERQRAEQIEREKGGVLAELAEVRGELELERQSKEEMEAGLKGKVEQAERHRQWFQQLLEESNGKLSGETKVQKLLRDEVFDLENKIKALTTAQEEMSGQYTDTTKQRDELLATNEVLENAVEKWKTDLLQQKEDFKQDMERMHLIKEELRVAKEELEAHKDRFEEQEQKTAMFMESNENLLAQMKEKVGNEEAAQNELRETQRKAELSTSSLAKLKEDYKKLKERNAVLEDSKMKLGFALEVNDVLQSKFEKQSMHVEDVRATGAQLLKKSKAQLDKLQFDMQVAQETLEAVRAKGKAQADKIADLEDLIVAKEEHADSLLMQLEKNSDQTARSEAATEEYQRRLNKATDKNVKYEAEIEDLRENLTDAARKINKLESELQQTTATLQERTATWKAEKEKLESVLQETTAARNQLQNRVDQLTPKEKALAAAQVDLAELHVKYTNALTEIEHMTNRYQHTERERNTLSEKLSDTQYNLEVAEKRIEELLEEVSTLQDEKKAQAEYAEQLQDEWNACKRQLADSQRQHQQEREMREECNIELRIEQEEGRRLLDATTQQAEDLNLARTTNLNLEKDNEQLQGEIYAKEITIKELQGILENTVKSFSAERKEMKAANTLLMDEFYNMWQQVGNDMKQKSEITEKAMNIQQQLQVAQDVLAKESESHVSAQQKIEDMTATMKKQFEEARRLKAQMEAERQAILDKEIRDREQAQSEMRARKFKDAAERKKLNEDFLKKSLEVKKEIEENMKNDLNKAKKLMQERENEMIAQMKNLEERLASEAAEVEKQRAANMDLRRDGQKLRQDILDAIEEREEQKAENKRIYNEFEAEIAMANTQCSTLRKKLESEVTARKWWDKYSKQLSANLQEAKLDIIRMGRKTILSVKSTQTQYCELWSRNQPEKAESVRSTWTQSTLHRRAENVPSLAKIKKLLPLLYSSKVAADMMAARAGRGPPSMEECVYDFFLNKYGLQEATERHLFEFAAGIMANVADFEVERFAMQCGMVTNPDKADGMPSISKTQLVTANLTKFYPTSGTTLKRSTHVNRSELFTIDYARMGAALEFNLADTMEKIVPNAFTPDCCVHPVLEAATERMLSTPGLEAIVRYMEEPLVIDELVMKDMGFLVSEEHLPQLHLLLVEACDILGVEYPSLYIMPNAGNLAICLAFKGLLPRLIISSDLVDMLTPRELQSVMAQKLAPLIVQAHSRLYTNASNASNLLQIAADILLGMDGARGQFDTGIRPELARWYQFYNLIADRFALAVTQNVETVISAIGKWTFGTKLLADQVDLTSLIAQSTQPSVTISKQIEHLLLKADGDNFMKARSSLILLRVKELLKWQASETYAELVHDSRPYILEGAPSASVSASLASSPTKKGSSGGFKDSSPTALSQ